MARSKRPLIADLIDGAIAGAVATWVMGQVTNALYARENQAARQREDRVRHGTTAYEVAAEKAATLAGTTLSKQERQRFGSAIHWSLGVGAGALFGALRSRTPSVARGAGTLFGAAFWLAMDEAATPALGLTAGPLSFPWQTHARGLVGHLVFGSVANATLATLQPKPHSTVTDFARFLG
jgi:uncharacterized membrane protein YagU involved in acid resistance